MPCLFVTCWTSQGVARKKASAARLREQYSWLVCIEKRKSHMWKTSWPIWESWCILTEKDEDYREDTVWKDRARGLFSEAFVTSMRVPLGNTYCTLNFLGCQGKMCVPQIFYKVLTSWNVGKVERNVECVKSIFQRHSRLYLSRTEEERTGYPVSEAPAHKIKNASCLHPYEVPYRNRPHSSSPRVLSKMVLE